MRKLAVLDDRSVLSVAGADRVAFLQGLVSNDVAAIQSGQAMWAALLTAQGKWTADFFIIADGARLLLDCETAQCEAIARKLTTYKLRNDVTIGRTDLHVAVAWDGEPEIAGAIVARDGRLEEAGWRVLFEGVLDGSEAADEWDRHRLRLGLPDGSRDLEAGKTVLLEAGFDELGGVSWTKGCYMGQELTARTRYRGLVKRRLVPVAGPAALPAPETPVTAGGEEVGRMRSSRDELGLAVVRIDALDKPLEAGGVRLVPHIPGWLRLPAAAG